MLLLYVLFTLCVMRGADGLDLSCNADFCNPNWTPFDNMVSGLRGYNMRTADPFANYGDPGFVSQIFLPTYITPQNTIVLYDGITAAEWSFCKKSLKSERFSTVEQYRKFITESSSSGYDLQIGTEAEVTAGVDIEAASISATTTVPPPFSRSWGKSRKSSSMEQFFMEKHGLLTTVLGTCIMYDMSVNMFDLPPFTTPFKEALVELIKVTSMGKYEKKIAFKRLINSFGTHFLLNAKLGAQFIHMTKYSKTTREELNIDTLEKCNQKSGSRVFGIQVEENSAGCTGKDESELESLGSENVEEETVTKGSKSLNDIKDWATNDFTPVPLKFQLSPIINLFTDKNIKSADITVNGEKITSTLELRKWLVPMYYDLCEVYGGDKETCHIPPTGCGYNDECPADTICSGKHEKHHCTQWSSWKCTNNCNEKRTRECFGCDGTTVETRTENCKAGHPCLYQSIVFVIGDGEGGKEKKIGKADNEAECANNCLELMVRSNPKINGATFDIRNKDCYCELGQKRTSIDRDYRNAWFKFQNPYIPPKVECNYVSGDGKSEREYYIGYFPTKGHCSAECDKLRRVVRKINGAAYEPAKKKCWCERRMYRLMKNSKYETCQFRIAKPEKELPCTFIAADGAGGSETDIGKLPNAEACRHECEVRRRKDTTINGVTYSPSSRDCYCEQGQTYQKYSSSWKNCVLDAKPTYPDSNCIFAKDNGKAYKDYYIGTENSENECATACYLLKSIVPKIHGASYSSFNKACYCEGNIKHYIPYDAKLFRTCHFDE